MPVDDDTQRFLQGLMIEASLNQDGTLRAISLAFLHELPTPALLRRETIAFNGLFLLHVQ
jgi:hypothetical protein